MASIEAQSSAEDSKSASDGNWGESTATSSSNDNADGESSEAVSSNAWGDGNAANGDGTSQQDSSSWCDESSANVHSEDSTSNASKAQDSSANAVSTVAESSKGSNDNESQASTTGLQFTTEEESSNPGTSSSHQSSAYKDDKWTISDDGLLRGMKEADGGGATWAEISNALCKSKSQVRARWRVIKEQKPSSSEEHTTEPETTTEPEQTTDAEAMSGVEQTDGNASSLEEASKDNTSDQNLTGSKEDGDKKFQDEGEATTDDNTANKAQRGKYTQGRGNKRQKRKKEGISNNNKRHKGVRNNKVAAENKQAKFRECEELEQVLSGEEASSESSSSSSSPASSSSLTDFGYGDMEWRRQMRYLQDHMYTTLYPPEIRPEPDAHFTARDCRLLAVLDSKQKRNRWLAMQADFYNVTGRMVPLEVLRDKCEHAEEVERRRASIEKWVDGVSQQN